jgi:hypothetical protein
MNRYALVYTFLGIIMLALVYVIGMPWFSESRKHALTRTRRSQRRRRPRE